jgi:hypothetical protein
MALTTAESKKKHRDHYAYDDETATEGVELHRACHSSEKNALPWTLYAVANQKW